MGAYPWRETFPLGATGCPPKGRVTTVNSRTPNRGPRGRTTGDRWFDTQTRWFVLAVPAHHAQINFLLNCLFRAIGNLGHKLIMRARAAPVARTHTWE